MADRSDEQLPPLGEPTPGRPGPVEASTPRHSRKAPVVGLVGLVVGALLGFGLASIVGVGDDDDDNVAMDRNGRVQSLRQTTTTTAVTVPPECVDAVRSAQQSLNLLDQGFQSLRRLEVGDVERMLARLQELRGDLADRVRECLERT